MVELNNNLPMTNMLNVRVIETGEELTIPDVEPLESAKLFWQVSDNIWQNSANDHQLSCFDIESVVPATQAKELINNVLLNIDKNFVLSGIGKSIKIKGQYPEDEFTVSKELLDKPSGARVGTFNWDARNSWRTSQIDDKLQTVEFTDDHKDRHRELYVSLDFLDKDFSFIQLIYSMQRLQQNQDQPTSLAMVLWHSQLADTGYEGNHLEYVDLNVEQELQMLYLFSKLGGLSIRAL